MRPVTMQPATPRSRIFSMAESTRGRSSSSSPSSVPSKSNATSLYRTVASLRLRHSFSHARGARVLRQSLEVREKRKRLRVLGHALRTVLHDAERAHEVVG